MPGLPRFRGLGTLLLCVAAVGCEPADGGADGVLTSIDIDEIESGNASSSVFGGTWGFAAEVSETDCVGDRLPELDDVLSFEIPILQAGGTLNSTVPGVNFRGGANEDGAVIFGRYWTEDGVELVELIEGSMRLKGEQGATFSGTFNRHYLTPVDCTARGTVTGDTPGISPE